MQNNINSQYTSQPHKLIDFKELNDKLEAEKVLVFIGYSGSNPISSKVDAKCRDYCPIHKSENTRSLVINTINNTFFCHNCEEKGDLIGLVAKALAISNKSAAEKLKSEFGIESRLSRTSVSAGRHASLEHNAKKGVSLQKANTPEAQAMVNEKWSKAKTCHSHPYFDTKKERPCPGLKYGPDNAGFLSIIVPLRNIKGELTTLQYVNENMKRFLKGAKQEDGFFSVGDIALTDKIYVTEGLATLITVWRALDKKIPVISLGSVVRMEKIVRALHDEHPNLKIIMCLETGNASIKQAKKIQSIPKVFFCMPCFKGMTNYHSEEKLSDYNDIISKCGQPIDIVTKQLMKEFKMPKAEKNREKPKNNSINPATQIKESEFEQQSNMINLEFIKNKSINYLLSIPPEMPILIKIFDGADSKSFIRKGIVGGVIGAGGIGKTHFLTQLALAVTMGETFLEKYTISKKGNVALILGENSEDDIHRLIHKMVNGLYKKEDLEEIAKRLAVMSCCGKDVSFITKNQPTVFFNNLTKHLKEREPTDGWALIIFDPISRFLGADAENDNAAATQFISLLERFTLELKGKPTVLFGHHMNKGGFGKAKTDQTASRGSSALTDGVRWQANLDKVEDGQGGYKTDEVCLRVVKSNFTKIYDPHMLKKDNQGRLQHLTIFAQTTKRESRKDAMVRNNLEQKRVGGKTTKAIAKSFSIRSHTEIKENT